MSLSTHIEIVAYVAVLLFVVYFPPKKLVGIGGFIDRHLGDSVGFYILHLGIILVILAGVYPQLSGVKETGNSLILAGATTLKLTKDPSPSTPVTPVEAPKA